jgi:hypothetical protein
MAVNYCGICFITLATGAKVIKSFFFVTETFRTDKLGCFVPGEYSLD